MARGITDSPSYPASGLSPNFGDDLQKNISSELGQESSASIEGGANKPSPAVPISDASSQPGNFCFCNFDFKKVIFCYCNFDIKKDNFSFCKKKLTLVL